MNSSDLRNQAPQALTVYQERDKLASDLKKATERITELEAQVAELRDMLQAARAQANLYRPV